MKRVLRRNISLRTFGLVTSICLCQCAANTSAGCAHPVLKHQRQDQATIRQLERMWTIAFLTGDTQFERCLLTADFTEIMSDGNINHLNDELALAEKNRGKLVTNPDIPPMTIKIHGDVAVAYYTPSSENVKDGKLHKSYFADYFVWKDGGWHVYFAQQTSFAM
jgi:hypothetical protein